MCCLIDQLHWVSFVFCLFFFVEENKSVIELDEDAACVCQISVINTLMLRGGLFFCFFGIKFCFESNICIWFNVLLVESINIELEESVIPFDKTQFLRSENMLVYNRRAKFRR